MASATLSSLKDRSSRAWRATSGLSPPLRMMARSMNAEGGQAVMQCPKKVKRLKGRRTYKMGLMYRGREAKEVVVRTR